MKVSFYRHIIVFYGVLITVSSNAQNWNFYEKISANDRQSESAFGKSVDIEGSIAVCGSPYEDYDSLGNNFQSDAGAAYVYEKIGPNEWTQVDKLVAPDRKPMANFGNSVAISGDYIVVGAFHEDMNQFGYDSLYQAGAAYIFKNQGGGDWTFMQKIVANDRMEGAYFGYSVAINNEDIAVGALEEAYDENGLNHMYESGAVYTYKLNGTSWTQEQKLVAWDRFGNDHFANVALSDEYLVVGAHDQKLDYNSLNVLLYAGAVYTFTKDSLGVWQNGQKITASDRSQWSKFGYSLDIDGDNIIVGAPWDKTNSYGVGPYMTYAGSVYFYSLSNGIWGNESKFISSYRQQLNRFGYNVALKNNMAAIGFYYHSHYDGNPFVTYSGAIEIYDRDYSGNWSLSEEIAAPIRNNDDYFGRAVATDGITILVGAENEDEDSLEINTLLNAGSAYFFKSCKTDTSFYIDDCSSYYWAQTGLTYTTTGIYTDTMNNMNGCDSILILHLTIDNLGQQYEVACDSFFWAADGNTYSSSGIYSTLLTNQQGCDSLAVLNLSIASNDTTLQASNCGYYYWNLPDSTYNNSGQYSFVLPNAYGCDSTIILDLTILPTYNNVDTVSACDSYVWNQNGVEYANSGLYTDSYSNINGCDSTVSLFLTIYPMDTIIYVDSCTEYTWALNGATYTSSGIYSDTLIGSLGCDSVVSLNLSLNQPIGTLTQINDYTFISDDDNAMYQWIDCSDSSAINGETNQWITLFGNLSAAVVVNNAGCIDTSECVVIESADLTEISINTSKKLIKITDLIGRETEDKPNTTLIYIYSDGTTEKVYRME